MNRGTFAKAAGIHAFSEMDENGSPTLALAIVSDDDLNADGQTNILDAYLLARQIERDPTDLALDLDADGQINQRDIDWIANQSVALNLGEQG